MSIVPVIKIAAGLATSLGAGTVVGNAIKATTPTGMKMATKIFVGIGGVVLSGIAGDVAAKYVEDQIQGIADGFTLGKKLGNARAEAYEREAKTAESAAKHAGESAESTSDGDSSPDESN